MRVAVTGPSGYLGINLVEELLARGHEVTALERRTDAAPGNGNGDEVRRIRCDVLDEESLAGAFEGHELVFHLAAKITLHEVDRDAWETNTVGVRNVARAALAAGVRRLVHCSSVHAFDTSLPGVLSEGSPRAESPRLGLYDRSKWAGERELRAVVDEGLDAVVCNPTGVFGPADHPGRLSRMNGMLRTAALGRVPADVAGGFDWVDVRDVVEGLLLAAERGATGENYLLGGEHLSIHRAFGLAAGVVGRPPPAVTFPLRLVRGILPLARAVSRRAGSDLVTDASIAALTWSPVVDHGKAERELGFRARSSEQTIRDLVAWFVRQGLLDRRRGR